ncbi:MAG TPA: helix-turn-helix transcriptional regulator [Chloroflexota bacterium]|nr:helix-turn-helix transcriptional regulator [Chloroflexota bacterium]
MPPGADPQGGGPGLPLSPARGRRSGPLPLRPRGGFGGYLHELRRERGLTVRHLAASAGVHHTYVSKLERGDRQAPDEPVVEALARALQATPAQLDQLRWRAGLAPAGTGAPGQDDPTLTLVAEALGSGALSPTGRDRLRQAIAQAVQQSEPVAGPHAGHLPGGAPPLSADPAAGLPPAGFPPPGQPGWPQGGLPPAPQLPPAPLGAPARVEPAERATREGVENSERLRKGCSKRPTWEGVGMTGCAWATSCASRPPPTAGGPAPRSSGAIVTTATPSWTP